MEKLAEYLSDKSKTEFASEINTSPSYLSQILSGHRNPSLRMMRRIENASGGVVGLAAWSTSNGSSFGASE